MDIFTSDESLRYMALEFERIVLKTEQLAITCGVDAIALRVAQQETRLAVTRCRQARNRLAQDLYKSNQEKHLSHAPTSTT